jgi:hypothetical protein
LLTVSFGRFIDPQAHTPELAHNLESAHNASHEFYFSSISEEYLVAFMAVLSDLADLEYK